MKLLLIQPKLPESFWSFTWAFREIARDKRAPISPLGLATVAALTPPAWEVRIVDENVEPIPWDEPADVVGGPYASLCPEEYGGAADTVVAGEAEYTWPRFCTDFEKGRPEAIYRETGTVQLADSPVPRHDLLKLDQYQSVAIQFSRGCPF